MRFLLSVSFILMIMGPVRAQTDLTYWQDIRPIFRKHCTACHSTKNVNKIDISGGLALDTFAGTKKGSPSKVGAVLTPGKSDKSLLHSLLTTSDVKLRMPLDADPLPKDKIDLIKKWIDAGAKEGTPPVDESPLPTTKKTPTRKLDLVLPTTTIPPSGTTFGLKATGKLDLAMKIGPLAPITAVAFSPNHKLLAAGSYGQVVIWDLDAGKPIKLLTNVLGTVNDLRFNPRGDILAVGGGQPSAKGDLRLYQVGDWKLLTALRGHDDVVFSLAFSPDGEQLASASFDHTVRLWDVKKGETIRSYAHHSDFVYAVAFSPSGKQLVSASKDRTVQLFDVETGKSAFTFSGMDQDVMAVAFHPDGKSVVSSGFEAGIYWWNTQTGEKIKTQGGHGIAVHELAFSKDGKRVVSAGADRTVRTWDGTAGTVVKIFPVGSVAYCAAIGGKYVASGSFDGVVRVWDEGSARQLASFIAYAADGEQPEWIALTPEGYATGSDKLLALARWRVGGKEVPPAIAWSALRQAPLVGRSLRGDTLPAPVFEKK